MKKEKKRIWLHGPDSPEGPWSKPVDLKVGGIDPEHVVDEKVTDIYYSAQAIYTH